MKMSKIDLPMTLDGDGSPQDDMYRKFEKEADQERMNILTIKEICAILKISRITVIRWIRAGKLPAFKPGEGRGWRVHRSDFDEFVGGKHGHS
jgi:excisionase family DNA binding protein